MGIEVMSPILTRIEGANDVWPACCATAGLAGIGSHWQRRLDAGSTRWRRKEVGDYTPSWLSTKPPEDRRA